MVMYYIAQIPVLYMSNRIQQFGSFVSKLGTYENHYKNGFRTCLVFVALIDLYDFVYSFMFESREYDEIMSDENTLSNSHTNPTFYKWSYSLSFAMSHLILWSLCCAIEFIVQFDKQEEKIVATKKNTTTKAENQTVVVAEFSLLCRLSL